MLDVRGNVTSTSFVSSSCNSTERAMADAGTFKSGEFFIQRGDSVVHTIDVDKCARTVDAGNVAYTVDVMSTARQQQLSVPRAEASKTLLSPSQEAAVGPPGTRSKINSIILLAQRYHNSLAAFIRELLLPGENLANIKLLGSIKRVQAERGRTRMAGYAIHPLSSFRKYWDILIMLIMFVNMFVLPLHISFSMQAFEGFLTFTDILCLLDILLNFRTGYKTDDEVTSYELGGVKVARKYLKTWFVIDLISSLPLHDIIMTIYGEHEQVSLGLKSASRALKFMKTFRLLHLLKLLRLSRIMRGIMIYEDVHRITSSFMRYIKLIAMMMLVAHWNGCLHFLIPMLQGFPKDCWVELCKLKTETWYTQYGWALFKTLSHMLCIGYGRFIPVLLSEALLTNFTMVTGATFYALFIAQSMAYMIQRDYSKISYMEKVKQTNEYLAYRNVPEDIKERVDAYFNQKYTHGRYFNEDEVLSEISKPIRDDIVRYTCRDIIHNIPYLKDASPELLSTILSLLSSDVCLAGDVIIQEGKMGSEMYFIRHGEVDVSVTDIPIERLSAGDYFGEVNALVEEKRVYTVKAVNPCSIVILSGNEFKLILEEHASMRTLLEHGAIMRLVNIYNHCKLHIIDDTLMLLGDSKQQDDDGEHNSTRHLYRLLKRYLERLLRNDADAMQSDRHTSLFRLQNEVEVLLNLVVQSHREVHAQCDLSIFLINEIPGTPQVPIITFN